jgi:hypothetical protein
MMIDTVECKECSTVVRRKRLAQRYCSKPCSVRAAMRRMRKKSGNKVAPLPPSTGKC